MLDKYRLGMSRAGFVLPTVTMVMLVVILLTIAISLRSFNRVEDARNVRVNQSLLSAATPALDRARAKLEELLVNNPPTTDTPTDDALYLELTTTVGGDKYTFGDEQRLKVGYKINDSLDPDGADGDPDTIEDNATMETAWRFPVDTDNNGKYDSFTLYGIFFRSPQRNEVGGFRWARTPLDARTPPMASAATANNPDCEAIAGTSSILVGDSGWYKSGSSLKKSFFTYTATVPITDLSVVTGDYSVGDFETFKGTTGYSALEYQQDWSRIPLTNNAVVYENDLEVAPGPVFRLNGRIQANSNFIVSSTGGRSIDFYLVSSPNSCFYADEENSKIIVGGNVVNGLLERNDSTNFDVHLQNGNNQGEDQVTSTRQSVTDSAQNAAYNSQASAQRLQWLRDDQIAAHPGTAPDYIVAEDPREVQTKVENSTDPEKERENALETYFKQLIRKVPFAEVNAGVTEVRPTGTLITGTGDELRPDIDSWVLPTNGDIEVASGNTTGLTIQVAELDATDPLEKEDGIQKFVGDRVLVGNNLPQKVWNDDDNSFASGFEQQVDDTTEWLNAAGEDSGRLRTRTPQIKTIADVGSTDRDGFWEDAAATEPEAPLDGIGGLRVITGAGVYERTNSFLPPPPENPDDFTVVWPDTMPMSPVEVDGSRVYNNDSNSWFAFTDLTTDPLDTTNYPAVTPTIDPNTPQYAKGDLRMRATAVYYYAEDFINDNDDSSQAPIACISSYYDPSTSTTAKNSTGLADVSGLAAPTYDTVEGIIGKSNNGIVYGPPTGARPGAGTFDSATGLFTGTTELEKQANMVFPNGRFVNEKLRDALQKNDADRSLSEQAAIDTTMCALGILTNTGLGTRPTYIADGAIREVSFLDARQIKASDQDNATTTNIDETLTIFDLTVGGTELADLTSTSDLPLEERQPMEIRATQLDLDVLRQAAFTPSTSVGPRRDGNEYLLPLSGIIYASRDDALPDRSDSDSTSNDELGDSPYDYNLDPTRRPNAIMLVNGITVARPEPGTMTTEEVTKEKGMTLVSNLPVYIQGDFNLHQKDSDTNIEEFTDELDNNWGDFYGRDTLDPNFACRGGDPRLTRCTTGDDWRPVNILSDALTLLSDQWRPGFRNEGDFDLNNNAGNQVVKELRHNNGFFSNSYATNGLTSGATVDFDGGPYTDNNYTNNNNATNNGALNSSYFNNFGTPVQRRINNFPEYVMEVCPKLPVSACHPDDWVVGEITSGTLVDSLDPDDSSTIKIIDLFSSYYTGGVLNNGINFANDDISVNITGLVATLASGTSAITPDVVQRFPRRIAFLRNQYGELELDDQNRPIPIGVVNNDTIRAFPYGRTEPPVLPRVNQTNVLWFRMTDDPDLPSDNGEIIYDVANRPLFYLDYDENSDYSGNRLILSPTPEINGVSLIDDNGVLDADDAYDYSFCTGAGISQDYYGLNEDVTMNTDPCPTTASNNIQALRTQLIGLDASLDDATGGTPTISNSTVTLAGDTDENGIVVYELPVSGDLETETYTLEGDSNDIFVLKTPASTSMTFESGVTLELKGVNPNNIFWVSDGGMTFNDPTTLAGNFLGTATGTLTIDDNTKILGGRLLGFASAPTASTGSGIDIRAISNGGNPSLIPVLQIHEPDARNIGQENIRNNNNSASQRTAWMVRASNTQFNLVGAAGDTPSRPGQSNGGLQNLVRLQENWKRPTERTLTILGGFIELERTKYATANYQQLINTTGTSDLFGYPQKYGSGGAGGILGFQVAPDRQWGFDVGLLSQSPDLFAQKFSLPSSDSKPDEFYREVGRDDPWIEALLCAEDLSGNDVTSRSGVDCSNYDDD
ncbi:MAG: DUF3494 domain-containing protein [Okeania sp. SIO3I5]|nr:DUF3494 domain-containing protein [Okeania sp. SIO3I5]